MINEQEIKNNNIGTAIQYFREKNHITQSKLCKGLCSVSTLSRIEGGERDADSLLLEALLERLGKTPYQFELILTDYDYGAYQCRNEIIKLILNKDIDQAYILINQYEDLTDDKGSPHKQYIMLCHARLNELKGGEPETTIDMLMEAISYTVPDFNTKDIADYFLSNSELSIIIDILQKMISIRRLDQAKKIITQITNYLYLHNQMEKSNGIYPKVAVIASRFYMEQKNMDKALEICNKGIELNKGVAEMDYLGDLKLIKAQIIEAQLMATNMWNIANKEECIKHYLMAYHIFNFCGEYTTANEIKKHLMEEYQWVDID
jgi:transcriptional regulator with XRE-family HTH domain